MRIVLWCLYIFFVPLQASSSQPICLNMIVKNERSVILRCLASVKSLIDYWVIVDTGSSDGTQEIIKEYMQDVPGDLYERPWKNFAANRNEALALAKGKGAYILFMDADDWLAYEPGFSWPLLSHDMYQMWRKISGVSFLNHQLVRSDCDWVWKSVVHEYLSCKTPYSLSTLEKISYEVGNDGASHSDANKMKKYVAMLEESLAQDPHNWRDRFSLAKSYEGAGQQERALSLYEDFYKYLIEISPFDEHCFWTLMDIGRVKTNLQMPFEECVNTYYKAHRAAPCRVEPMYYLAELYNQHHRFDLAYACLKGMSHVLIRKQTGQLMNEDWIEEFGVLFQLSICSFYVGRYEEARDSCKRLLSMPSLPAQFRKDVEKNYQLMNQFGRHSTY